MTNQIDLISVEGLKTMVENSFEKGMFLEDFKNFVHTLPKSELETFVVEILTANVKTNTNQDKL
jgi:hypothetical protein